ncbi:hypothetical protein MVG78_16770 [Roseomonas gilardii subsp. gilardii]|uniref:hypothetical protein n=1 Tax=Roseomonas gilardii TaxID=257708 RepID=UPI001FF951C7|nr:hypothetical protein [Roseomonas gilardii]UPG72155.1 hypothetical protein MVG78_16770 [Roseomonas gilardii subsp. gilardii]
MRISLRLGFAPLMAVAIMAAAPAVALAAEGGGYSRYTPGSTPRDVSGTGSSAVRGMPLADLPVTSERFGSTVLNESNAGSSAVNGVPHGNMPVTNSTPGATPLDVSNNT